MIAILILLSFVFIDDITEITLSMMHTSRHSWICSNSDWILLSFASLIWFSVVHRYLIKPMYSMPGYCESFSYLDFPILISHFSLPYFMKFYIRAVQTFIHQSFLFCTRITHTIKKLFGLSDPISSCIFKMLSLRFHY